MSNLATTPKTTSSLMPTNLKEGMEFSEMISKSDIIPVHYRNKPANCFIALNTAHKMNLDPLQVMSSTFIVGGKLGMSAAFAISLANCSGLFTSGLRFKTEGTGDDMQVTAYTNCRKTNDLISFTVSMRMAIAEGWVKNPKYKTLPELMLIYRSATFLIRTHAPQVLNGMHTVEELEDIKAAKATDVTPPTTAINGYQTPIEAMNAILDNNPLLKDEEVSVSTVDTCDILIEEANYTLETLLELIGTYNVSDDIIGKMCAKAGKSTINEFNDEELERAIKGIKTKYEQKNDNN